MRGKKTDSVFVSQFIVESIQQGMETPDQIVQHAKDQISQIDDEIRAVEAKKITRSKLLDVILNFEKPSKDRADDAKILEFFKLKDPMRCKEICELMKVHLSLPVLSWRSFGDDAAQYNFCVKQLLEAKVIMRVSDQLMRGEQFDEYMKFVLREVQ
jgi:hypothetical protein